MRDPRADPLELDRARGSLRHKLFGGDDEPFRVGRYVVHGKIGTGGLGVVYSGWDPKLDRKVALKFVRADRRGGDDDTEQRRLLREARSIARLTHPNVVQVFDVGTHEDQVFIAMQLVEGKSIRGWLDQRVRSWRDITLVFLGAARGLAAAHDASIVHRDFKPDNLLVDASGEAVVVDFGLARSTSLGVPTPSPDRLSRASGRASTHSLAGTPGYIAPELLGGGPASPLSDQWSFFASLYESLFGEVPVSGRVTPPHVPRIPSRIARLLSRGLDPDPERRHPSMHVVATELQRSLSGRTKGVVVTGVLGLLAASGWAAAARDDAPACDGGSRRTVEVWDDDRRTSIKQSMEVVGTEFSRVAWPRVERAIDDYTSRWARQHHEICEATARGEQSAELLDHRMGCLDGKLVELDQSLSTVLRGDAAMNALPIVRGLSPIEPCADLQRDARSDSLEPPEALRAQLQPVYAGLAGLRSMYLGGLYAEGHGEAEKLLAQAKSVGFGPPIAEATFWMGHFEDDLGHTDAAYEHGAKAFALAVETGHEYFAMRSAWLLGVVEGASRTDLEPGLAHLRVARAFATRAGLRDTADWAQLQHSLGYVLGEHGLLGRAQELTLEALELRERTLGPDHPDVAASLLNLSGGALLLGRTDEALGYAQRCVELYRSLYGRRHPDVAMATGNLARVLSATGQHEVAAATYADLIELFETLLGPDHAATQASYNNLAYELLVFGRVDEAKTALLSASASAAAGGRASAPNDLWTLQLLSEVEMKNGDPDAAARLLLSALEGYAQLEATHPMELAAHTRLAEVRLSQSRWEEAVVAAQAGLEVLERNEDLRGTDYEAAAKAALARGLWQTQRADDAVGMAEQALRLVHGPEPSDYATCLSKNIANWLDAARAGTDPENTGPGCAYFTDGP